MKDERFAVPLVLVLVLVLASPLQAVPPGYTVTPLDAPPPWFPDTAGARDINDSAQLCGAGMMVLEFPPFGMLPALRAFSWSGGVMTPLGTLGGRESMAYGVNDLGLVVGWADTAANSRHAFYWTSHVGMHDIGSGAAGDSEAYGVNSSAWIVGKAEFGVHERWRAFLWTGAAGMTDLGTLGGEKSEAADINDAGLIVGTAETPAGASEASLRAVGGPMQGLGHLGGGWSSASAINNLGQVVGASSTATGTHAFLWHEGVMHDLGTLGGDWSYAHDVNDSGAVVGEAMTGVPYIHGFLWENGHMYDLNDLVPTDIGIFVVLEAYGINNAGQIIAQALVEGKEKCLLLTPIPEPPSAALFLAGLAFAARWARRVRRG